jgi:protein-L-isoaspartate(D-aspartate) O-methyltransferase
MDLIDLVASLKDEGIHDERVLRAIAEVPRDRFVPPEYADHAWEDRPLPIGMGQTISQPFIVAFMIQALCLKGDERVLDIGTGSGYQAAVLARLCRAVYTVEILPLLLDSARARLSDLKIANVQSKSADGWGGWPDAAPFGGIVSAAAAPRVPEQLVAQLASGARLVLPVGGADQRLLVVQRGVDGEAQVVRSLPVRFVPMTGQAERL